MQFAALCLRTLGFRFKLPTTQNSKPKPISRVHPADKVLHSGANDPTPPLWALAFHSSPDRGHNKKKNFVALFTGTYSALCSVALFRSATVESKRELRTGSGPDGKLPAGNHRQFRCYCPLQPPHQGGDSE